MRRVRSKASSLAPHDAGPVPVVVVTYRAPVGVLERAVRSLVDVDPGGGLSIEVIVVDNGGRAAARLAEAGVDGVRVLESSGNFGFGAAANQGFEAALASGAGAVVCLNDDVIVRPGWLAPLVAALDEHDAGAVQPLLVQHGTEPGVVNSAGVTIDRFGAGSDWRRGEPIADIGDEPVQVPAVTGGAVLFSAAFLGDVGGFDERFFLYYEDVELCRRGAAAGWTYWLVPAARVEHLGSVTTDLLGDHRLFLQERNRLWTVAMYGRPAEVASALSLSVRRLRHAPHAIHRRALVAGVRGALPRWIARIRGADTAAARKAATGVAVRRPLSGVNVVGYHHISSGLGDAARLFTQSLRAAGVDVVAIDNDVSASPRRRAAEPAPTAVYDTTVAFVTAFEFEGFCHRHPELVGPGRRMIGYWFWELSTVPAEHVQAMRLADEVWTATTFVRDAYEAVADAATPVRLTPLRLPEPTLDAAKVAAWRQRFGGAFVVLVSFDYLSIPERKNPQAAIAAFRDAFAPGDDGIRLLVKSINRHARPDDADDVERCAGGDDRIEFLDEHLDEADHHALVAAADCYVSPHRSEGLGLQAALAMWLGTPVVATRYGGVTDFLDDDTAFLCGYTLGAVDRGEGIYPAGAPWADIDHDELVAHMRTVRSDQAARDRVIAAARRRIESQPSLAEFGRRYVDVLCSLERDAPAPDGDQGNAGTS